MALAGGAAGAGGRRQWPSAALRLRLVVALVLLREVAAQCRAGQYSTCGQYCTMCYQCSPGKFSSMSGATSCIVCEAGKYSRDGSSACIDCATGQFATGGNAACEDCAPGKFSSRSGASSCIDCEAGKASEASGLSESACIDCVAGHYSTESGSRACIRCNAGQYTPGAMEVCIDCDAGQMSAAASSACATNCDVGFQQGSDTHAAECFGEFKTDCVAGQYADSDKTCTACAAGQMSAPGSVTCNTTCPADFQQGSGTHSSTCFATHDDVCDVATYPMGCSRYGLTRMNGTSLCPPGTGVDIASAAFRAASSQDQYDAIVPCTSCPFKARCPKTGSCSEGATGNLCGSCRSGFFSLGPICTLCSGGTFWSLVLTAVAFVAMLVVFWNFAKTAGATATMNCVISLGTDDSATKTAQGLKDQMKEQFNWADDSIALDADALQDQADTVEETDTVEEPAKSGIWSEICTHVTEAFPSDELKEGSETLLAFRNGVAASDTPALICHLTESWCDSPNSREHLVWHLVLKTIGADELQKLVKEETADELRKDEVLQRVLDMDDNDRAALWDGSFFLTATASTKADGLLQQLGCPDSRVCEDPQQLLHDAHRFVASERGNPELKRRQEDFVRAYKEAAPGAEDVAKKALEVATAAGLDTAALEAKVVKAAEKAARSTFTKTAPNTGRPTSPTVNLTALKHTLVVDAAHAATQVQALVVSITWPHISFSILLMLLPNIDWPDFVTTLASFIQILSFLDAGLFARPECFVAVDASAAHKKLVRFCTTHGGYWLALASFATYSMIKNRRAAASVVKAGAQTASSHAVNASVWAFALFHAVLLRSCLGTLSCIADLSGRTGDDSCQSANDGVCNDVCSEVCMDAYDDEGWRIEGLSCSRCVGWNFDLDTPDHQHDELCSADSLDQYPGQPHEDACGSSDSCIWDSCNGDSCDWDSFDCCPPDTDAADCATLGDTSWLGHLQTDPDTSCDARTTYFMVMLVATLALLALREYLAAKEEADEQPQGATDQFSHDIDHAIATPRGFATTWSADKRWTSHADLDASALLATDTSNTDGMWMCSADVLPPTGQHYFEVVFSGCSSSPEYQGVGIWTDSDPPHCYRSQDITKNGRPFWGMRGDGDGDALRIMGRGKGKVGFNKDRKAISNDERIGLLVDMDVSEVSFLRNGDPIDKAIASGFREKNTVRVAACCWTGMISLSCGRPDPHAPPPAEYSVAEQTDAQTDALDHLFAWCRLFWVLFLILGLISKYGKLGFIVITVGLLETAAVVRRTRHSGPETGVSAMTAAMVLNCIFLLLYIIIDHPEELGTVEYSLPTLGTLGLFIYGLAIPRFFYRKLRAASDDGALNTPACRNRYGFLFTRFKEGCWGAEFRILGRKSVLLFVSTLFAEQWYLVIPAQLCALSWALWKQCVEVPFAEVGFARKAFAKDHPDGRGWTRGDNLEAMALLAQIFNTLSALLVATGVAEAIDTEIVVVTLVFVLLPVCYGLQMVVDDMWMGKKGKPLSPAWLLAAEARLAQVRDGILPGKAVAISPVSAGSIDSDGPSMVEQTANPVSSSAAPEKAQPTAQDREWFAQLDEDDSGLLSKAEAKAMMLDLIQAGDYAITEAWFESTWRVVDADDNNELDIHEFAELMKLVRRQHNSNRD
eukprot:COSAG06_NODE_3329_length_5495_cov_1.452557_1_plen_1648_part_10